MIPISQHEIPHVLLNKLGVINKIAFPRQGYTSDVGIIDSAKGTVVLKRTKGKPYSEWLRRESYILECLAQTHLRVPQVYQFMQHEDDNDDIQSWLLMECLRGETLRSVLTYENDSAARYKIIYDFGRCLRELHSTPCPEGLKQSGLWLDYMLKQAEYNLEHYEVDGNPALLEKINTQKPKDIGQTLIHGDFTIDNVLVHEGRISGVIDWSGGAYGDPRYDVSLAIRPKPNIFQSVKDRSAFHEGYGAKVISSEEYDYYVEGLNAFF
ncbi:phosphotransferase family protein [Paenibacillus spongiae]|uniref:Phosphotransferase n=1 Tax=Paenibacillus spongiae TaxID=2909671 RepID=A0ABY5SGE3_9BACL|nr:phosphotransferase [Paenibacillus spongiae]UVI32839.1 phosphotransferase [Paenibacillus spongiae]